MYPVMGNQRPTDVWCPMGYRSHSFLTAGHISLCSMYPVMGNQRPTDAWCPMGYRPTAFSRPGTSRYTRCTRLWGISVLRTHGARWVTDPQHSHGRAHLAILDVPGYGESASYGRMVPDGVQTHSFLTTGDIIHNSYFIIMISRGIC